MRWALAIAVFAGLLIALYVLTRPDEPAPSVPSPTIVKPGATDAPPTVRTQVVPVAEAWQHSSSDVAARAAREKLLTAIRDPHAGHESWDDQALAILDRVSHGAVATSDVGCYMAGCIGTFTFGSEASYRRVRDEVTAAPDYVAWTGGKQFTAPERLGDGHVIVALALQRPD